MNPYEPRDDDTADDPKERPPEQSWFLTIIEMANGDPMIGLFLIGLVIVAVMAAWDLLSKSLL